MHLSPGFSLGADHIDVWFPVELPTLNKILRLTKRARIRLEGRQKEATGWNLTRVQRWLKLDEIHEVQLYRHAPRKYDEVNHWGAFKFIQDAIATFLGTHDGPTGPLQWQFLHEIDRSYGVRIRFLLRPEISTVKTPSVESSTASTRTTSEPAFEPRNSYRGWDVTIGPKRSESTESESS